MPLEHVTGFLQVPAIAGCSWQRVLTNALCRGLRELRDESDEARHLEIGQTSFAVLDKESYKRVLLKSELKAKAKIDEIKAPFKKVVEQGKFFLTVTKV